MPETAATAPETAGAATAAAGPSPVVWSRRLRHIATGLLLLGALGVVAVASMLVVISGGTGDYATSSERFSPVQGDVEVTIEDETVLGLFYDPEDPPVSPGGNCRVTGPDGERLSEYAGAIQSPAIDGAYHVGIRGFETTGPGVYTVACAEPGFLAGPAYRTSEPGPGLEGGLVGGVLLVVATALLLSAVPAVPLLLAALIVRLVQGHREETPARRRRERWLSLVVACLVCGLVLCGLDAVTVVVGLLDPERAAGDREPFLSALGTLPVLVVLLVLAVIGVLRLWRGRGAPEITIDPTAP